MVKRIFELNSQFVCKYDIPESVGMQSGGLCNIFAY